MQPCTLRITFLGTGTSVGIPVITCGCQVCTSTDPRDRRLRASLLLQWVDGQQNVTSDVLVDTSTDLRQQALRARIQRVDGVLYTHAHADHVLGLDELRIFNFVHRRSIPLYGSADTLERIRAMFSYAFDPEALAVPRLRMCPIAPGEAEVCGHAIEAIPVAHGNDTTFAYRVGGFAYVTDCNHVPEAAVARLQSLDLLVIDALRRKPHRSHFSLEQALRQIELLQPRLALLTHLSHDLGHAAVQAELPAGVDVAYDGLVVNLTLEESP